MMRIPAFLQSPLLTIVIPVLALFAMAICPVLAAEAEPSSVHKVVLQISDDDPARQTLVLNVAQNLLEAYGADQVDLEIVAFGPGLQLVFADNINKGRISGLTAEGVRFAACSKTISRMTQKLGHEPAINPEVTRAAAGVVRIIELTNDGYTLIRP